MNSDNPSSLRHKVRVSFLSNFKEHASQTPLQSGAETQPKLCSNNADPQPPKGPDPLTSPSTTQRLARRPASRLLGDPPSPKLPRPEPNHKGAAEMLDQMKKKRVKTKSFFSLWLKSNCHGSARHGRRPAAKRSGWWPRLRAALGGKHINSHEGKAPSQGPDWTEGRSLNADIQHDGDPHVPFHLTWALINYWHQIESWRAPVALSSRMMDRQGGAAPTGLASRRRNSSVCCLCSGVGIPGDFDLKSMHEAKSKTMSVVSSAIVASV